MVEKASKEPADWRHEVEKAWALLSWHGEIQWFGCREEHGKKRTIGGRLYNLDSLIGSVRNAEALGWNFYCNANPSRRGAKIKLSREDITHWRYLVLDLDPSEESLVPPRFDSVAHRIFSGRGYQCWIPVLPMQPTLTDAALYERVMAGYIKYHSGAEWTNGWQIDTSCSDLARVVRCPGSINQKTGKRSVVEFMNAAGKEYRDLVGLAAPPPDPTPMLQDATSLVDVLPHLTIKAKRFLLEGIDSPGRHAACWHTTKLLHELGVPAETAREWVMRGAFLCRPHDNEFVREAMTIVRRTYGTAAGSS